MGYVLIMCKEIRFQKETLIKALEVKLERSLWLNKYTMMCSITTDVSKAQSMLLRKPTYDIL